MFAVLKFIWELVVLRDASRKGLLTLRKWAFAIGFVLLLYGTGVPAAVLYSNHPEQKPIFVAAIIFDASLIIAFAVWALRTWIRKLHAGRIQGGGTIDSQ